LLGKLDEVPARYDWNRSMTSLPHHRFYRAVVARAKQIKFLKVLVKSLSIGRNVEIANLLRSANLGEHDVVCDVGCGDGFWSNRFSQHAKLVVAFDPFWSDLENARDYASDKALFVAAVGENIPFESSSVDKVVSVCVFEHCPDDQEMFREMFRILRPGGKLVATVDSLDSVHVTAAHREWHRKEYHCNQLYTADSLRHGLTAAGFKQVKTAYLMGSRAAVLWEVLTERVGASITLLAPVFSPFIRWGETKEHRSGYKILVEARKDDVS